MIVINAKSPKWYAFNSKPKYKRNDKNDGKTHSHNEKMNDEQFCSVVKLHVYI